MLRRPRARDLSLRRFPEAVRGLYMRYASSSSTPSGSKRSLPLGKTSSEVVPDNKPLVVETHVRGSDHIGFGRRTYRNARGTEAHRGTTPRLCRPHLSKLMRHGARPAARRARPPSDPRPSLRLARAPFLRGGSVCHCHAPPTMTPSRKHTMHQAITPQAKSIAASRPTEYVGHTAARQSMSSHKNEREVESGQAA